MSTRFFISAIPLFDSKMAVHAYHMMTQDGDKLLGAAEDFRMLGGELLAPAIELVKDIGVEPFSGRHDFFLGLSKYQLLIGMPVNMKIPPDNLVCVIDKETLTDNAAYAKMGILKRNGYRMALSGLPGAISLETASKFFDFVVLSCKSPSFTEEVKAIQPYIFNVKLVITDVPDAASFTKLASISDVLLSGDFYSQPITVGVTDISPLKINSLNLLKQINEEGFDLVSAASTIERDPALSISLLRFINAMNPDRSRKIDSIRRAVAILGQKEVKKWATVAISISIGEDRPSEITKLSLIRAKFAENLAPAFSMSMKSGSLFIAGLFSLLDVILQKPMHFAIEEVAADSEIKDALVDGKGSIHDVLSLILAYERADWHTASIKMVRNEIDIEVLTQAFLDSLYWYRQLLDAIDEANYPSSDDVGAGYGDGDSDGDGDGDEEDADSQ